jgi:hypothetical protein
VPLGVCEGEERVSSIFEADKGTSKNILLSSISKKKMSLTVIKPYGALFFTQNLVVGTSPPCMDQTGQPFRFTEHHSIV